MLKRVNIDNLNEKELERLSYKAAFSQFISSLECNNSENKKWKCCDNFYEELKQLHKHVSLKHSNDIKHSSQKLEMAQKSLNQQAIEEQDFNDNIFLNNTMNFKCNCGAKKFEVLLFYRYIQIILSLDLFKKWMIELCDNLSLKGKIRIAKEGINGTVEGCVCATSEYKQQLLKQKYLDLKVEDFKSSEGNGFAFESLAVSVCEELCTLGISSKFLKADEGGRHLTPEEFHELLETSSSEKNGPVLLDVRNFYESKIGYFNGAVKPNLRKFSYFPEYVEKNLDLFKGRQVLTYCTGGIRCERATAYLQKNTECAEVFQLKGGIHKYLEKYPDGFYEGKLFVFDNRYSIMGENSQTTSTCLYCDKLCDSYELCTTQKCRQLVLICRECRRKSNTTCCISCANNMTGTPECDCTLNRERAPLEK